MKKVVIAADCSGFRLKEVIKTHLIKLNYAVIDVGQQQPEERVTYIEAAGNMARAIQSGEFAKGIVFCGTGTGVSIVCNKFKGVYAVACESAFSAIKIATVNNANVIAIGENTVGPGNAEVIVDTFLSNAFCQRFDVARRDFVRGLFHELEELEKDNFR